MLVDLDAARYAVCPDCADGDPPVLSIDVWWHVNTGNICNANKLHGLPRIDPDALRIEGAEAMRAVVVAHINTPLVGDMWATPQKHRLIMRAALHAAILIVRNLDPAAVVREAQR